jgi:hypothetical protein
MLSINQSSVAADVSRLRFLVGLDIGAPSRKLLSQVLVAEGIDKGGSFSFTQRTPVWVDVACYSSQEPLAASQGGFPGARPSSAAATPQAECPPVRGTNSCPKF